MCSKFITVRFAPGSGGKFISTLLQLSPDVNAWDQELENIKRSSNLELYLDYIKSKFNDDFVNWLKQEPDVPYKMDWVSNRFDRGNDVTYDQAMQYLKNDYMFQEHYDNNKKIILISNKSRVPDWLPHGSTMINVLIDSKWATKWVYKARLHKQFLKIADGRWIIKQDHPDYCSEKKSHLARQFQNSVEFQGTDYQFLRRYIITDPFVLRFQNTSDILDDSTNKNHFQIFWHLSCFQNKEKVVSHLGKICKECKITMPPGQILLPIIEYYLGLHHRLIHVENNS